ncbi:hypothetical protein EBN88_11320 [Streptomyces triticirhizae]|uniref:Rhs protein n=1 Tax=Streptomyces triticirhizae TaxID=2483353 RepID=A0A3M2LUY9_9ACTN|nr:hypothetical protein EBN88_11320 [Streptomyces triticirhizae]
MDMDRDPTPGDPDEVRELADDLQEFADDVGEALGKIRGLASERAVLDWAGLSADAFRSEFEGVPDNLTKLEDSYSLCAQALHAYWPKLQTAQGMADRALDRAISAQADLASAQAALGDAQDWVGRAGEEAERLQREGERDNVEPPDENDVRAAARDQQAAEAAAGAAQSRVNDAEERLAAARQLALDAQEMREEAARVCAQGVEEASDAGIQNRKWWQKAIKWVTDNWDTIVAVCKVIVAVLGIVVMIIGGPLAWVVLAAALVVLADTLIKYARGEAGLLDVAFAALDCIPGMKGLTTLGGLARGMRGLATTGLRGLRQGALGLGQSLRRLGRRGGDLVCRTDPIDMATGEVVMEATDVELPGVLPLVLRRHHRTRLRLGRYFGPSWSSTLDQRLLLDPAGLRFFTDDGMVLDYPRPSHDEPVLPVEGPRWPLTWDSTRRGPLTVRNPETGHTWTFAPVAGHPETELPLVGVSDRNGNQIAIEHDGQGQPAMVRHSGGYHIGVTCHEGRILALRLLSAPDSPALARYAYDDRGNLTEVCDASGSPMRLGYDDQGRVSEWRDRNGFGYAYHYDEQSRCVGTTGPDGYLSSHVTYDTEHLRTVFTDSLGRTSVYQFDDSFRLESETDPLGHTVRHRYDRYDRPLEVTDSLGRSTRYAYDDQGRLTRLTRPDGSTVRTEYGELGLPVTIIQPNGEVWRQEYDAAGNRTLLVAPDGRQTAYRYDASGGLRSIVNPEGQTTTVRCDDAGLPVFLAGPEGNELRCVRDGFGRPSVIEDRTGARTVTEWNASGRPLRVVDAQGGVQTYTWDDEGNCLSWTDQDGASVHFEYGPFDLPIARTDPDGSRTLFERDTELRLTRVTNDQGRQWNYTYDAAGRLIHESDFYGREVRYELDAAGQVIRRTNSLGQFVAFHHDALGNVVEKTVDGATTVFTRDAAGRVVRAVGPHGELEIERDPFGRVVSEAVNGKAVHTSYDAAGRVVFRRTPAGHESHWSYDQAGLPREAVIAGQTVTFERDAAWRETHRRFAAGALTLESEWDAAGQLVERTVLRAGTPVRRRSYTYRPSGNLTAVGDPLTGHTTDYQLDPAGRVTDVLSAGHREKYRYAPPDDARGAADYTAFPAGRRERVNGVHHTYDAAGRVVARRQKRLSRTPDTWQYEWDGEDRLTQVTTPDGTRWRYLYDPFGRRLAKQRLTDDGRVAEETRFVWAETTLVEQTTVHGDTSSRTLSWDYDGTVPLTQTEISDDENDRRFFAIVTDLVGTPTELYDEAGGKVWERNASLWGAPLGDAPGTGSVDIPLDFPGQYRDWETGWHYNVLRYYDPLTACYVSPDPLGLAAGPDDYAYVPNPLTWLDPLGLAACPIIADNSLLVQAMRGHTGALAEVTGRQVHVTPNQLHEFLNVTSGLNARRNFLATHDIQVITGQAARDIVAHPEFRTVFDAIARTHGRPDAALVAFAHASGMQAVTMERRLTNFVTQSLNLPGIDLSNALRRVI